MSLRPFFAASAVLTFAALASIATDSRADVEHTVARGHTLEAIANRYHVTVKAIMEANHLHDTKHLRVGDVLTIPTGTSNASGKTSVAAAHDAHENGHGKAKTAAPAHESYASRPRSPGLVHVTRIATQEDFAIRVNDRRGRQSPVAEKQFEKLMRSPAGNATSPIDTRLIALVGIVSNHFGGRKLEVISGFRPYKTTQYTPHSNHNHGKAIDFRVVGVPNEVVRDFCRTLRNTGCGYYPNSVFVHMDVRDKPAYWIDYSRPGEAPRYNAPDVDADEGASDVHGDTAEGPQDNAPSQAPPATPNAPATAPTNGPVNLTPPSPINESGVTNDPPGSNPTPVLRPVPSAPPNAPDSH